VTSAVLGAVTPDEVRVNLEGARASIPAEFWLELQRLDLLPDDLPVPTSPPVPKERS
jgi:hypothetical protein